MIDAPRRKMTEAEFLDWDSQQEGFYEFDGEYVDARSGGPWDHWAVQRNLFGLLFAGLKGQRCQPYSAGMKIRTARGIRCPDAFVVCTRIDPAAQVIDDPVVVFEIVSPGSDTLDHVQKAREYGDTPSIQRYAILEQTTQAATVFSRQGDDWAGRLVLGDTMLDLPEIGLSLPMAEIYAGALTEAEPQP
jgi:hypothetical protein